MSIIYISPYKSPAAYILRKKKKSPDLYVSIIPFTDKETKTQTKKQMEWHLPLVNTTSKNMLFPLSIQPATKTVLSKRHLQKKKRKMQEKAGVSGIKGKTA